MTRCLTGEQLEWLSRGPVGWWRGFVWRRHLRLCDGCRRRWQGLRADEALLSELRQAVASPPGRGGTADAAGDQAARGR